MKAREKYRVSSYVGTKGTKQAESENETRIIYQLISPCNPPLGAIHITDVCPLARTVTLTFKGIHESVLYGLMPLIPNVPPLML